MKKSILDIGTPLSKSEQKEVFGGWVQPGDGTIWYGAGSSTGQPGGSGLGSGPRGPECTTDDDCCHYQHNSGTGYVCSSGVCAPGLSPNPFCDL